MLDRNLGRCPRLLLVCTFGAERRYTYSMASSPKPNLSHLTWKSDCGYQIATDGSRFYMRESALSIVSGVIFGVGIAGTSAVCGVWALVTQKELSGRGFGVFLLLIAAFFFWLMWTTARRGRWMVVYDRGEAGRPGEILYQGKRIAAEKLKSISTRWTGGNPPRRTVAAELNDGAVVMLGPVGISTWPDYWGQMAANWMGVPFRQSSS